MNKFYSMAQIILNIKADMSKAVLLGLVLLVASTSAITINHEDSSYSSSSLSSLSIWGEGEGGTCFFQL